MPLSESTRQAVHDRTEGRCEYCLMPDAAAYHAHQVDHIIAVQHGGADDLDNLALSCVRCNRYKGPNLGSIDPDTGDLVAFFHPRKQRWETHFRLSEGYITGLTPEGRVTERLLRFNDPERVLERLTWVE